jgi:hypothetical protein
MRLAVTITMLLGLGAILTGELARAADPGMEFFEKKIRPLLVEHCYKCHSDEAKKPKGGLRLDTRDGVMKGGDSGPALVAGKPAESLLLTAVRYTNPDLKMPPKGKLPESAIADLEKWIATGAKDPRVDVKVASERRGLDLEAGRRFWAYQPVRKMPVPGVKDQAWPHCDIDRFILSSLEAAGLKPVIDVDRTTLIRRVYFDLVGLPPTPEQVDAFFNDKSTDAFVRVVDELLASPHFGERWGRHWLDVARFAESSGGGRTLLFPDAWRYRDYVIDAFNNDKPYDRFVMEQIAGDLMAPLPGADAPGSPPQIATAFLALGPTNYERQDKDILEMDVIDEQLDTLGRAFLGQTIGCARCHDHKFDPIPTRDYYALAGIFKSTQTLIHDNVSRWVDVPLPLPAEQDTVLKRHEAAVAALQARIKSARESEARAVAADAAKPASGPIKPSSLPGIVLDDSHGKKVGAWKHSTSAKGYIGDGYLHDENTGKGQKTLTFTPEFPKQGRYEVRLAFTPGTNRATKVPVHILHLDGEFTGHVDERRSPPIDGRFISLGTFRFDTSGQWYVIVSNEDTDGHVIVDAVQFLPEDMASGGRKPSEPAPTKPATESVAKQLEDELKRLTDKGPKRPLAMGVKEAAKIDDCHICVRGNFHNKGEKVQRGFLTVLTPVAHAPGSPVSPSGSPPANVSGRKQLAEWLASRENPLTARVMVNRIWHWLFGAGLVRTVDVFGTTGELPSHPELLDYLAQRFMDGGWSVKSLIREIVSSRTYQLSSSVPTADSRTLLAVDPENRLLWRMNRRRLDAECLRDAILCVSDQLDRRVGGSNLKQGTTSEYDYKFDDSRRSVYTPVLRNKLLELFEAFDFPDPNIVSGKRNVSTVATQALYLMNSPFVMEQAKHAADRTLAAKDVDDAVRVGWAYRTSLGRLPTANEREIVLRMLVAAGNDANQQRAAWERVHRALFGCIDFRYVD